LPVLGVPQGTPSAPDGSEANSRQRQREPSRREAGLQALTEFDASAFREAPDLPVPRENPLRLALLDLRLSMITHIVCRAGYVLSLPKTRSAWSRGPPRPSREGLRPTEYLPSNATY